jgi:hypothetical protein
MNKNEHKRIGYIYTLRSYKTDKFFIGCTFQRLSKKLFEHKKSYDHKEKNKYCEGSEILKYNDYYIELLKECHVKNKYELLKILGESKRNNINNIVKKSEIIYKKYNCEFCHIEINYKNRSRHLKSLKHKNNIIKKEELKTDKNE